MREKFTIEDIANMFYSKRRQAEIIGIHSSTWQADLNNPHWQSSQRHMKKLQQHIKRELEHIRNSTPYPEAKQWAQETLTYMQTMELFQNSDM